MKLTNNKTKWLLLKADTNSDWDPCNAFLVELDDISEKSLSNIADDLIELKKKQPDVYDIRVWYSGWYLCVDESHDWLQELFGEGNDHIDSMFVDFESDEEDAFIETYSVEQDISIQTIDITTTKISKFAGSGKHTGEEFYTRSFYIP